MHLVYGNEDVADDTYHGVVGLQSKVSRKWAGGWGPIGQATLEGGRGRKRERKRMRETETERDR
jgi:hypothetical protein